MFDLFGIDGARSVVVSLLADIVDRGALGDGLRFGLRH
jgi:hypothetical protein